MVIWALRSLLLLTLVVKDDKAAMTMSDRLKALSCGTRGKTRADVAGRAKAVSLQRRRTLKRPVRCQGVALHTGRDVSMTLYPAAADQGIIFRRTDICDGRDDRIPALWSAVSDTRLNTTLSNRDGVSISTVEHLMAALAGCGIDDVTIAVDGPELPVMDGSAAPFLFLIDCAGVQVQDAPRWGVQILREVTVEDRGRRVSIAPADALEIDFSIDFADAAVARQRMRLRIDPTSFRRDLARARTFGFLHEVEAMRAAGLALGGSLDNAVVVGDGKVLNDDGLRYGDEFVRHKILDCVGDLSLAGAPILGRVTADRAGHHLNNLLLRAVFADDAHWAPVALPAVLGPDADDVIPSREPAHFIPSAYAVAV